MTTCNGLAAFVDHMSVTARSQADWLLLCRLSATSRALRTPDRTVDCMLANCGVSPTPGVDPFAKITRYWAMCSIVSALQKYGVLAGSFAMFAFDYFRSGSSPEWTPRDIDLFVGKNLTASDLDWIVDDLEQGGWSFTMISGLPDAYTLPERLTETRLLEKAAVVARVASLKRWQAHDWDALLPRHPGERYVGYEIAGIEYADVQATYCDGALEFRLNFVFTDLPDPAAPFAVTDSFDLVPCQISLAVEHGELLYRMRSDTMRCLEAKQLQLTRNAFRRVGDDMQSIRRQLKRLRKYMHRGYALPIRPSGPASL